MYKGQSLTKSLKKGCIVNITHSMCIPDNLATSPNLRQCEENAIEKKLWVKAIQAAGWFIMRNPHHSSLLN